MIKRGIEVKRRILILTPNKGISGGVNNYVNVLKKEIKDLYILDSFHVGRSKNRIYNIFYPFLVINQNKKLKRFIKRFKPDVVHINPSLHYTAIFRDLFFLKTIHRLNIPTVFFIHGWQHGLMDKLMRPSFRKHFKKAMDRADVIVVLASQFKEKLTEFGIDPEKIVIETTMVDSNRFIPRNKNPGPPFKVLFCANMTREKGPFEVLTSIPHVIKKFPRSEFVFVGGGRDIHILREKTKKMGLTDNVRITGYISEEEKTEEFKNAHIFAFPTRHGEGFPTVVLESMASGQAVITTPNAGLRDAITDGVQGFLLKSDPPESKEIAKLIISMMDGTVDLGLMGNRNIIEAKEKYDVKIVAGRIADIYDHLSNKLY